MALLFNPPLNDHELATYLSLSKAFGGAVINPQYLPVQRKPGAEQALAEWCERHEMRHWPSWVTQWHTEYTARKDKERLAGRHADQSHNRSGVADAAPGTA